MKKMEKLGLYKSCYVEQINEAEKFTSDIEIIIRKYFPNSLVNVRYSGAKGRITESITISFGLGKDKSEWSNGIWHNDPMWSIYFIHGLEGSHSLTKEGKLADKMQLTSSSAGNIMTKDFKIIKVGFRKKTGNAMVIVKHIDAYFKKMKQLAVINKDKINDLGNHL